MSGPGGPTGWEEDPLESLARELRQTVGSELRAEAEDVELETEISRRRHLTMAEVMRESAERGDRVSLVTPGRTVTGMLVHVGRDYVTLETESELVDARLDAVVAVVDRMPAGGATPQRGSITFRARLSEYEQSRERVTLVMSKLGHTVEGVVDVVAEDHVIALERDGATTVCPIEAIELTLRPRPSGR